MVLNQYGLVQVRLYRIAQLFGGGKYWRIWRTEHHSPIFYPAKFQIH